jgi:hypothetical protein
LEFGFLWIGFVGLSPELGDFVFFPQVRAKDRDPFDALDSPHGHNSGGVVEFSGFLEVIGLALPSISISIGIPGFYFFGVGVLDCDSLAS